MSSEIIMPLSALPGGVLAYSLLPFLHSRDMTRLLIAAGARSIITIDSSAAVAAPKCGTSFPSLAHAVRLQLVHRATHLLLPIDESSSSSSSNELNSAVSSSRAQMEFWRQGLKWRDWHKAPIKANSRVCCLFEQPNSNQINSEGVLIGCGEIQPTQTNPVNRNSFPGLLALPPRVSEWNTDRLLAFLHAYERLSLLHREFQRHRVRMFLNLADVEVAPAATEPVYNPVPFLLPWPVADGLNDDRAAALGDVTAADATSIPLQRLRWRSMSPLKDETLERWEWLDPSSPEWVRAAADCPFSPEAPDVADYEISVGALSGVVRGCPWPLPHMPYFNSSYQMVQTRLEGEIGVVARRISEQLGVANEFKEVARASVFGFRPDARRFSSLQVQPPPHPDDEIQQNSFWFRLLQDSVAATSEASEGALNVANPPLPLPIWKPLPAPLADLLTQHLRSSLTVSLASEHVCPWPTLLVAPLAPGWIGGFMGGGDWFD